MLKTFPLGGIHPPENKISSGAELQRLPAPKNVSVFVSQHIGAPAKILVNRKDQVKTGQLIAESGGAISANIHAPFSGSVKKIEDIPDASGYKKSAITIKVEGDEWVEGVDTTTDINTDISAGKDEIIKKINDAGVVGLGGATFPTHIKLKPPKGMTADTLIINGVECEPYLTIDHRLMLERGHELMVGTQILMKALGVNRGIIGIENNKTDAIKYLKKLSKEYQGIEIQPLKVKYPQGGEKQLIKSILGREVPSGGLPIAVGTVVQNVGTTIAVYEAVQKNKPLVERAVTVSGLEVQKPINVIARIGTPVKDLIDAAGGLPENTGKVVAGGPMTGKSVDSLDVPVVKSTSGVILFPDYKAKRGQVRDCIRCRKCVSVCPMGLEPFYLMTQTQMKNYERLEDELVMDCIECGSCSFICPANRPLLDYIKYGKTTVGNIIRSRKN